jgi:hypothetical protein
MSGKIIITTPFPTPAEVASFLGIPAKRVSELDRMIAEIHAGETSRGDRKKNAQRTGSRKSSNGGRVSRSKK